MTKMQFVLASLFTLACAAELTLAQQGTGTGTATGNSTTNTVNTTPPATGNTGPGTPGTNAATPGATTRGAVQLTDAEIAGVLSTVNHAEMEAAKLAQKKANNKDVKNFAKQMMQDHTLAQKETRDTAKQAKIPPVEPSLAKDMKTQAESTMKELQNMKGAEFDKAFLQAQITMHRQVLDTIDTQLMPQAKSDVMRKQLQQTRPKIEAHLRQAETLQGKMQQ